MELPFTLTHPKPPEEMMASAVPRTVTANNAAASAKKDGDSLPVDPDLIHIDTRYNITRPANHSAVSRHRQSIQC